MYEKRIIGERGITALLIGVILLLAVPLLFGAAYTYPAADDFIFENGSTEWANMAGSIRGHFAAAWNYYMTWEGRYLSNLLLFTVLPFTRFGLNGFRFIMVLHSLFFEFALFFMVNGIISFLQTSRDVENKHSSRNKKLFLYAVLLFVALGLPGTWIGREIFYWHTGAVGYLLGISNLFLSIGCFFGANCREKKRRYYIGSSLFGFFAAGTCPQVASFVCSWLLITLLVVILESGRTQCHFWSLCPFLVSFFGAVINAASPGSMRRSRITMEEEGISYGLTEAVKDTFVCLKEELGEIFRDPVFIVLAVTLFLVCTCLGESAIKKERSVNWIGAFIMVCGVLASQFLCVFPVVLGYHGEGLYNERTKYVADFEIRFSLIFAIVYVAQCVSQVLLEKGKRNRLYCLTSIICGAFICTAGFLFQSDSAKENVGGGYSFELIQEFANGTVQEVFSLRKAVLDALESADDGTDVRLQMPLIPASRVTYSQGIADDPGVQTNQAVASMFHLNTVAVEYGVQ